MEIDYKAVITGDIINSTSYDLNTRKLIRELLMTEISSKLKNSFGKELIPLPIDVFRGDSWQLIINNPSISLRVCLFIRCLLKIKLTSNKINTRMSIGFGNASVPEEKVSLGDGDAYIFSGKGLDSIGNNRINLIIKFGINDLNSIKSVNYCVSSLPSILSLIDFISSNWTYKQSMAILGKLQNKTLIEISKDWFGSSINSATVTRHLSKAGWESIFESLNFFEKLLNN